jgi:hypothetical protein
MLAIALLTLPAIAHAEDPEPVPDVHVPIEQPPARRIALEIQPLPIITDLGKWTADVVLAPLDHHAVVATAFYTATATAPIVLQGADGSPMTRLPEQIFHGAGFELGYRYYAGSGGVRGWFVGPSLIAVSMFERQGQYGDGSHTHYLDLGLAMDAGYHVLVADRVSLGFAVGVQGLVTSKDVPDQQFPAKIYANSGIAPRLLFSIGWAP